MQPQSVVLNTDWIRGLTVKLGQAVCKNVLLLCVDRHLHRVTRINKLIC